MDVPVLFLIFKRPDTSNRVFQAIRKAKPRQLFISADGGRNETEIIACNTLREDILRQIDWDCEVKTLFREKNLGCQIAVSSGISWFFEQVEQGIILEDDCLPNESFFTFCEVLLEKYKDDKSVWHIGANNFQNGIKRGDSDYFFSMYSHIWGWASWRDRWQKYQVDVNHYNLESSLPFYTKNRMQFKYFKHRQKQVASGKMNTWDYQWLYCMWENKGLAALPNSNLVENIGFDSDATHTKADSFLSKYLTASLNLSNFPTQIIQNKEADEYAFKYVFLKSSGLMTRLRYILGI
jgi:hypothetical protein